MDKVTCFNVIDKGFLMILLMNEYTYGNWFESKATKKILATLKSKTAMSSILQPLIEQPRGCQVAAADHVVEQWSIGQYAA